MFVLETPSLAYLWRGKVITAIPLLQYCSAVILLQYCYRNTITILYHDLHMKSKKVFLTKQGHRQPGLHSKARALSTQPQNGLYYVLHAGNVWLLFDYREHAPPKGEMPDNLLTTSWLAGSSYKRMPYHSISPLIIFCHFLINSVTNPLSTKMTENNQSFFHFSQNF